MVKKLKSVKIKNKKKDKKLKEDNTVNKSITNIDPRAAFYAKQLETVEKDLQLVSNSVIEPERLSSGVLCIDYIFGGGFIGIVSLAGEEGSAKTSSIYHTLGVAKAQLKLPYVGFYDAEGAISTKYSGNIWKPFGLDVRELLSKKGREQGFYYYRDQVIERMFDYLKKALKMMPDKNWVEDAQSWCYFFPKRNDQFKKLMEIMEVKPSKSLSTGAFYVVPTENSGPEGLFGVDSFASLLTREEEDKEDTGSVRSAMDAAAFAKHLKRVKIDAMEKKVVVLGTNHLGSHVRQQYGGPDSQCFTGRTPVVLADGSIQTIRNIVRKKKKLEVLSFDPKTGKISAKKIINWFNNGNTDHTNFVKLGYSTLDRLGRKTTRYVECTKNHNIWTPSGWKKAGDLERGNKVFSFIKEDVFNEHQMDLIVGSLLGDGSITGTKSLIRLNWSHSVNQRPYLLWKLSIFGTDNVFERRSGVPNRLKILQASKTGVSGFSSFTDGYFNLKITKLIRSVYDPTKQTTSRKKSNINKLIDKLNLKSLAIWYMDDGHVNRKFGHVHFSCQRLTDNERKKIAKKISELTGIPFKKFKFYDRRIHLIQHEDVKRLMFCISPFVHPSMGYKLFQPELAGTYSWSSEKPRKRHVMIPSIIESIGNIRSKSHLVSRYDLEIEDNHTYFVGSPYGREGKLSLDEIKSGNFSSDDQDKRITRRTISPLLSGGLAVSNSYEKMGNSLKYYSDQRARLYSRASSSANKLSSFFTYDKNNSNFGIEKSVESNGSDRYAYKEIKNVKNKFGNPGLKLPFRVWVSDYKGKPRGIDPAFDVFVFLKSTKQLINAPKGAGKGYVFNLKPSIGKNRQGLLNSCKPFSFLTLKTLVIGEYTNDNSLIRKALSDMGLSKKPNLRESLFKQLKEDESLYSYETNSKEDDESDEEGIDYEEI